MSVLSSCSLDVVSTRSLGTSTSLSLRSSAEPTSVSWESAGENGGLFGENRPMIPPLPPDLPDPPERPELLLFCVFERERSGVRRGDRTAERGDSSAIVERGGLTGSTGPGPGETMENWEVLIDLVVYGVSLVTVAWDETELLRLSKLFLRSTRPLSAFKPFSFCLCLPRPHPNPHPSFLGCGGGGVVGREGTLYDSVSVLKVSLSASLVSVVTVSEDENELLR